MLLSAHTAREWVAAQTVHEVENPTGGSPWGFLMGFILVISQSLFHSLFHGFRVGGGNH
ncbi:hypothetical protein HNR62_003210 [Oceanisphaera litoralis]|nr:hypothetical protein [Oceanisphaera litoralis]